MRKMLLLGNAVIFGAFAALEIVGARVETGFLSGSRFGLSGPLYVLVWFALVLWVPITTLAVILDVGCGRLVQWRSSRRL